MASANHFASANRVQLRYIPETDWGVTPVAGNGVNLRMTGESLDFNLTKQSDKEIRDDRQMSSTTTVGASASGDVKIHMQYAEYDPFFAGLLQNTWGVYGTGGVSSTFTADFTTTTITASAAPTGANAFTNLKKGQWFQLRTGTGANNKKLLRVSSTTAPTATVITVDAATPLVAGSGVANCTVSSSRLSNGVAMPSFTLEKGMADIGQFLSYRGMCVSKFSTSFASGSLTEGTFSFMGKDSERFEATSLPGSPVASKPYDITNGVTGVGKLWENGVPLTSTSIKSMSIEIDNALRGQEAIGQLGYAGIGVGTFSVKGSIEVYFADGTMYDKFIQDVYTSIVLSTQDASGNGYVLTLPRVNLTSAKVQAGGKDTDLMMSFSYEAYADIANVDPTLVKTLFIDRVGVAV